MCLGNQSARYVCGFFPWNVWSILGRQTQLHEGAVNKTACHHMIVWMCHMVKCFVSHINIFKKKNHMITRKGKSMVKVSSQSQEKLKLELEEESVRNTRNTNITSKPEKQLHLVGYSLSLLLLEVLAWEGEGNKNKKILPLLEIWLPS